MIKVKTVYNGFLLLLGLCLVGCANSYTSRDPILTLQVTIHTREPISPSVRYYVILSGSPGILFPPLNTLMLTPGRYFNDSDTAVNAQGLRFYDGYLRTWQHYMVIENGEVSVYQSGGVSFVMPLDTSGVIVTSNFMASPLPSPFRPTITRDGNQLIIRWRPQDLTGAATRFWLQVATSTQEPGIGSGFLQDYLSQSQDILIQQGYTTYLNEGSAPFLSGPSDLVKSEVEVR
ncbi:hypothetical protein EBZ35_06215 [bacterium]|nr:hypothetical protein [bacterium]